jgi:Tfp pilus assembly protein PilN
MINLLPPATKKQLYAARSNTLLIRYNILLLVAILFLAIAIGLTYLYLSSVRAANENTVKANSAQEATYASVKTKAKSFRDNLSADKLVLNQSFNYANLVQEITKLLPSGVVLNNLTLDTKSFGTETTFAFRTKSFAAALELKDAFQKSSLFSNAHFASIAGSEDRTYPLTVNLSVTIKKDVAL